LEKVKSTAFFLLKKRKGGKGVKIWTSSIISLPPFYTNNWGQALRKGATARARNYRVFNKLLRIGQLPVKDAMKMWNIYTLDLA